MESQRSFLVIGLVMVSFLLWQQWQIDYGPQPVQTVEAEQSFESDAPLSVASADVPASQQTNDSPITENPLQQVSVIEVKTDTLDMLIDPRGGDVVSANLLKFPVEQGAEEAYSLLRPDRNTLYVAQSGLVGTNGPDANPAGRPMYGVQQQQYTMDGDTLIVPLSFKSADGLMITKQFIFNKGHHDVQVKYLVTNQSDSAKQVQQYGQLKQSLNGPEGSMFMPTYRGAAFSTQDTKYENILLTKLKMTI